MLNRPGDADARSAEHVPVLERVRARAGRGFDPVPAVVPTGGTLSGSAASRRDGALTVLNPRTGERVSLPGKGTGA